MHEPLVLWAFLFKFDPAEAHLTGFLYGLMMPVVLGCPAVLMDAWDPAEAARIIEAVRILREGIESIPEFEIIGVPEASILAFGSSELEIMAVGDALDDRGWCADRQKDPDALHLMVSPEHDRVAESFVHDLREAVRTRTNSRGKEARYN